LRCSHLRRRRLDRGDAVKKAFGRETVEEAQRGVDCRQETCWSFKTSTRI
jgi:hypothetical protein